MKIVLATTNPGKLKEFQDLSKSEPWLELVAPPDGFNVAESGNTFFENAKLKAVAAAQKTGMIAVADDSGLVVEALNGKPGIHSARYCPGEDSDRRAKLLADLAKVPDGKRQASFMCSMVVCEPNGTIAYNVLRVWEGRIGTKERGQNGFGYDPIFYLGNKDMTAAELPLDEKNRISHRGQAWHEVLKYLKTRGNAIEV